ncbi:breast carcinoma amplified sequence 2-domain-containing protein [Lactarius indigo]|nr:breast carcinoma amplified sequence 2-domain-containing protein [Lactarius indigo]
MAMQAAPAPQLFDSLPYYDNDLETHPILREKVQHELAVETQKIQQETLHPRVAPAVELFVNNPLLAAELGRVGARKPLTAIDTSRYQLASSSATPSSDEEWKAALDSAHAQLEHQRIRHNNLALLQQYGSNAWRTHNYLLEADAKKAEKILEELKEQTTSLNRDRKNTQTRLGEQLTSLENRWTELISSILQIELANVALEAEVARLNKRETELAMASSDAHMDTIDPQAQDTIISNGVAEAATVSAPASPPQSLTSALSDLSRTAEQGKDGSTPPHSVPSGTGAPPKKFSAFNINKKFMEKNSPTPGASQIPSSSPSSKIAGTTGESSNPYVRPIESSPTNGLAKSPPPAAPPHSRLITTKLTKLPSSSTSTGTGWTRPSSTTPSLAPSPVSGGVPSAPPLAPAPVSHGPPQLPHVGKVIQPQPRGAIPVPSTSKPEVSNGSSKPAWRNVKQGGNSSGAGPPLGVQSEFPTAAEVAQGCLNGSQEKRQSTQSPVTPSPAITEADTFRGVHLDPNAHHWDEMEEDNDDFLEGVIEFGDGRQYQIQPVDDVPQSTEDSVPAAILTADAPGPNLHSPTAAARMNKEDRFSEDFDRSWPRSATLSSNIRPRIGPSAAASTSSNSSLSPQEASRVLFNERSNRLEPWSTNSRIAPPDARPSRDAGLHHNVQLLQKQGLDRPRRDTSSSQGAEDRRWERGRRSSNATTTHSVLSGGRDSSRESLRQLPPHLAPAHKSLPPLHTHQPPHAYPPSGRQGPPRESWRQTRSPEQSPVIPSPSDLNSHVVSPSSPSAMVPSPQSITATADIELVRKAAMHSAAERAKIRRQLEEEEREKERERARKKAAELEEKMKVTEKDGTEQPVAVEETQTEPLSPLTSADPTPGRQSLFRPPSLRRQSQRGSQSANQPPSASSIVTSWRSNAGPLPPIAPRRLSSSHSPVAPLIPFPSPSQVLGAQLLSPSNDESLEEVEFTDLGKFVGFEPKAEEPVAPSPLPQEDIPAEVSYGDQSAPARSRSDLEFSWRRKGPLPPVEEQQPVVAANVVLDATFEPPLGREADIIPASPSVRTASIGMSSPVKPLAEVSSQTLVVPSLLSSQRSPRTPSYREELLRSTFEDTMSRIKGAMQTKPQRSTPEVEQHTDRATASGASHSSDQPRHRRGASPSSRSHPPRGLHPEEPFTTATELGDDLQVGQPHRVQLPSASRVLEPLSKKEQANLRKAIPPLRWEIFSWDPPVEGTSNNDYSVNDVLFRKPPPLKGQPRFIVNLPSSGSYLVRRNTPVTPKVHLPSKPLVNKTVAASGAFGRPRVADDHSTWRRTLPPISDQVESVVNSEELVTRSGSSPPDTEKTDDVVPSPETEPSSSVHLSNKRAEPKMPAGASVAFYRESNSVPSVNFIVSSELEGAQQSDVPAVLPKEEHSPTAQAFGDSVGRDSVNALAAPHDKSSDGSSDTPLTPPSSTSWAKSLVKESPVRQPDPEQLKLLWSQTSEKADVPAVNSLEGIADDLPSVPFTFQEVKSEDGETPPPTVSNGSGPLANVFARGNPSIPTGATSTRGLHHSQGVSPITRSTALYLGVSPASDVSSARAAGALCSPTLMFPHPMAPNHMIGGPSAQYHHQPMWIHMPPPPPGTQTPAGVVRPLPSPYPTHAQYMPYPSPTAYATSQAGPPGPQPQPPNGGRSRPSAAPAGMSPGLSHARAPAMYQSSPVLMHPQVMHVQPSYAGTMPAGRGVPMQPSHPTPAPHPGGYTPTAHASYARPPW